MHISLYMRKQLHFKADVWI